MSRNRHAARIYWMILLVMGILFSPFQAYAAGETQSCSPAPGIKLIVDGVEQGLEDGIITKNGAPMVPLRAVLNKIGVRNEHICWAGKEKKVTFQKGTANVELWVGRRTVKCNSKGLKMDIAPVLYENNRVYVDKSFLDKVLGYKVVWSESMKCLTVGDKDNFLTNRKLLLNAFKSMKSVEKYLVDYMFREEKEGFELHTVREVDIIQKRCYVITEMNSLGYQSYTEYCYSGDTRYMKEGTSQDWEISSVTPDQLQYELYASSVDSYIEQNDALYNGLSVIEEDEKEIVLKGDIYPLKVSKEEQSKDSSVESMYIEIHIEKSNFYITKVVMNAVGSRTAGSDKALDIYNVWQYSNFNDGTEIGLPVNEN